MAIEWIGSKEIKTLSKLSSVRRIFILFSILCGESDIIWPKIIWVTKQILCYRQDTMNVRTPPKHIVLFENKFPSISTQIFGSYLTRNERKKKKILLIRSTKSRWMLAQLGVRAHLFARRWHQPGGYDYDDDNNTTTMSTMLVLPCILVENANLLNPCEWSYLNRKLLLIWIYVCADDHL